MILFLFFLALTHSDALVTDSPQVDESKTR